VLPTKPQVARPGYRVLGQRRRGIGLVVVLRGSQQVIDFLRVETCQAEIEVRLVEFLQLEGEQLLVPICPGNGAIHHEAEGFHLRR